MKLKVGECSCAKNRRVYCRVSQKRLGYRFTGARCSNVGKKWKR